jgi:uncharacterized protein YbjT (DUF2867 family)
MILVTGATGNIGSNVLRRLSEAGVETRALSRDPSRGEALPHVEWAEADLDAPETLPPVFEGVDRLFLLTGNTRPMARLQKTAIDEAVAAGVDHVVKLSARGAQPQSKSAIGRWHHEVEIHLKASGLSWTMLRPHVFMQNLLDQAHRIRTDREIRAAAGDGRIPFIDTRDIADVAATVLTERVENHDGETYLLTGGAALDYDQVAAIIGAATDQDVSYVAESFEEARTRLQDEGLPDWLIDSTLALAEYQRAGGETARVTRDVFEVTGHPPRSMIQFAYDHRLAFAEHDAIPTTERSEPVPQ